MFNVERKIKEIDRNKIEYEYHLLNEYWISVGVFHNEELALKVRDLLNGDEECSK